MATTDSAPGFDTLSYAQRLKNAGVDERQAEAARDAITQGAASKVDLDKGLAALKADIDKGLGALKADIDKGLGALETRLVRNIYTVAAAQIVIIVGLLKLLP